MSLNLERDRDRDSMIKSRTKGRANFPHERTEIFARNDAFFFSCFPLLLLLACCCCLLLLLLVFVVVVVAAALKGFKFKNCA